MCSSDIPDTSPAQIAAAQANERVGMRQLDIQQQMNEYYKQRQTELDAFTKDAVARQLAMSEETQAQGRDIFEYQKEVFRPVEQSLVAQAMRESTPEYYERFAQQAMAQQATANANAQGQMERTLAGMGVNPNSGAYAANMRGLQLSNAANMGAAGNEARDRAEALSWARRAEAAGLGKGLVGAGNASYGLATGAVNSATGAMNQASQTAGATMGTPAQYGQLGVTALGNASQAYNDIYRAQVSAAAQSGSDMAGLFGAAGTAAAIYF